MKRNTLQIAVVTFIIMFLSISTVMFSQPPAPPPEHGLSGNQGPGGPAAIDGGSLFLLVSAGSYGIYKIIYALKKKSHGVE